MTTPIEKQSNLYRFENAKPPEVTITEVVPHPTDPAKTAGMFGMDTARGLVYLSPRVEKEHYFRKFEGYAISCSIFDAITREGAATIFIIEDGERMYEFDLGQYRRGESISVDGFDDQVLVPRANAKRCWADEEVYVQ